MGITAAYENSASISTTEYSLPNNGTTLTPITVDGCYQWFIDFNGLTAVADEYEVKVYEKVTSGGTQRVIWKSTINTPEILVLPSLLLLHGWDVTCIKTLGTARTILWSGRQVV